MPGRGQPGIHAPTKCPETQSWQGARTIEYPTDLARAFPELNRFLFSGLASRCLADCFVHDQWAGGYGADTGFVMDATLIFAA